MLTLSGQAEVAMAGGSKTSGKKRLAFFEKGLAAQALGHRVAEFSSCHLRKFVIMCSII